MLHPWQNVCVSKALIVIIFLKPETFARVPILHTSLFSVCDNKVCANRGKQALSWLLPHGRKLEQANPVQRLLRKSI